MPVYQIYAPIYDKLPLKLYGGAFELWLAPGATSEFGRACGYYFIDHTWHATPDHLLGWSREIIHCLDKSSWTKRIWAGTRPDWLCGHAFQWQKGSDTYKVSGTDNVYSIDQLIEFAKQAAAWLAEADVTLDQFGGTDHRHFLAAIQVRLTSNGNEGNIFLQNHIDRHGHLDAWILDQNGRNRIWHPSYPIRGPLNASGIGQTYCNTILNAAFQAGTFTGAATIFAALHSVVPSDTSDGTEAAYTGYARQSITCNSTNFANASAGTITYSPQITFPTNTGSSETEVAVSWQAASSGGTQPNWWGGFASTAVGTGIAPIFNNSALVTSGV